MNDQIVNTTSFTLSEKKLGENHSQIVIEPLESGYGHTLGNALRRVLLSSLPGVAFTSVRFMNVDHQFATIPGVTEDVLELSLNLKLVRVKSLVESGGICKLSAKGPKKVSASDLVCEGGLEIINGDQHIATLSEKAQLEFELVAERGFGYSLAKDRQSNTIGEIMLDSLYSPVISVSYHVDQTRVGRRTDFDKLTLNVVTNGTISPLDAVIESAQILVKQFSQVVNPIAPAVQEPVVQLSPEEVEVLRLTVEELDLPTRIANALRKGGFETVADLKKTPRGTIAKVKNLGDKSVDVIQEALTKKGVTLTA